MAGNGSCKPSFRGRRAALGAAVLTVFLAASMALLALPALASPVAREEAEGASVLREVERGDRSCSQLSAADFDHVGEYAMGRALGSPALHEAMNQRMTLMMGEAGETRMHVLMGRRYAGCGGPVFPAGFGRMMGAIGMMAGVGSSRGSMMGESELRGTGESELRGSMMGGRYWGDHHDDGVSAGWIVAGVVILIGATAIAFLAGRRMRGER